MDSFLFYKSMYDRELNRRYELDSALSIPITILTLIGTLFFFLVTKINAVVIFTELDWSSFLAVSVIVWFAFSYFRAVFWLLGSFNNFFRGYEYYTLGSMMEFRTLELKRLPEKNQSKDKPVEFSTIVIAALCKYADINKRINVKRGNYLFLSRKWMILCLSSHVLLASLLILQYLYHES